MSNLTRKEREFQDREARILAVSRAIIVRDGYHGLNMDRIAESIEYSKGTIYNHFPNKEEIIAELAIQTNQKRVQLFHRSIQFEGSARERMQGIGVASEIFARLYPHHFFLEQMIRMPSIWEKTSVERRTRFENCEFDCMNTVSSVVIDGVNEGDLQLPPEFKPEDLVFGLWSLVSAAYAIAECNPNLRQLGVDEPYSSVRVLAHRMLDGFNWKPLSHEKNYDEVVERLMNTIFANELDQLTTIAASK